MNLRSSLKGGDCVLGTWCIMPSPYTINVISRSGLDFVIIDMEHGPVDFTVAQEMTISAHESNCNAVVRIPELDKSNILRALDMGSDGVIVSDIRTPEDAAKVVSYAKYPPDGDRGYTPYSRSGGYAYSGTYMSKENNRITTGIIIESKEGLEGLDDIAKTKDLDLVYIGTYDISKILGCPGHTKNPKVVEVVEKCCKTIIGAGKSVGCLFHDDNELEYFKSLGIQFLAYKVDTSVLYDSYRSIANVKSGNNHTC